LGWSQILYVINLGLRTYCVNADTNSKIETILENIKNTEQIFKDRIKDRKLN
jgi:hypothetical protein